MKKIIRILFFTLSISFAWGQQEFDTLQIFISDGFNHDAVDLNINNVQVFSKEILKSNPIYGLTGRPLLILGKHKTYVVTCESYNCKGSKIKVKKRMNVTMLWKGKKYEWKFEINKGKFFIISFNARNNEMEMRQFLTQPGFD